MLIQPRMACSHTRRAALHMLLAVPLTACAAGLLHAQQPESNNTPTSEQAVSPVHKSAEGQPQPIEVRVQVDTQAANPTQRGPNWTPQSPPSPPERLELLRRATGIDRRPEAGSKPPVLHPGPPGPPGGHPPAMMFFGQAHPAPVPFVPSPQAPHQPSPQPTIESVDRLLASPAMQRILELMEENITLKAEQRIREAESKARSEIEELRVSRMLEEAQRLQLEAHEQLRTGREMQERAKEEQRQAERIVLESNEMREHAERMMRESNEMREQSERRLAEVAERQEQAERLMDQARQRPEGVQEGPRVAELERELDRIRREAESRAAMAEALELKLREMQRALEMAKQKLNAKGSDREDQAKQAPQRQREDRRSTDEPQRGKKDQGEKNSQLVPKTTIYLVV